MPRRSTPPGMTPPTPGLEHEEPEMTRELDIPREMDIAAEDGRASPSPEGSQKEAPGGERPLQEVKGE